MNLAGLETFIAIAETGSLIRASERLNVTQSTVTARLQALEQELGQVLFHRARSGARLSPAGIRFRRFAETMTGLWRQARAETARPGGTGITCNIGCHPDLWPGLGERLMEGVRRRQPQASVSAWPAGPEGLDRWLDTGLINAALTYQPTLRDGRTLHELKGEPLLLFTTRPGSPLRFDPGYVYVEAGEAFGRQHAAAYADAGIARLSFGSAVWALGHLKRDGGSAYLPERLAAAEVAAGRLHPVAEAPRFARKVYLVTSDAAAADWPWLPELIGELADPGN